MNTNDRRISIHKWTEQVLGQILGAYSRIEKHVKKKLGSFFGSKAEH